MHSMASPTFCQLLSLQTDKDDESSYAIDAEKECQIPSSNEIDFKSWVHTCLFWNSAVNECQGAWTSLKSYTKFKW